ncbi:hypothetical protein bpr_I0758 [Butyrivibrio proteoclasticus B316]|uniref:SH3b domain-containing protein n=1 Tax=Butyrivibrio proteoclasticus (strain ATCC 51982 / DSM 14932 / B316) TaxID=515622 RepID=E0S126_BUTPB|nr:hypothetical protein [Butyrivibrio proteoclasticus]ADL33501.1 hypothetical protein bpr_I0758 [Butyrivibrio proteoclasticus B316]
MRRVLLSLAVCIICLVLNAVPVMAAADEGVSFSQDMQSFSGQVMTLSQDTRAYATPDESSTGGRAFSKGESVYVVGETDGWYQIFYKGENLYIPVSSINSEDAEEAQAQAQALAEDVEVELKNAEKRDTVEIENAWREARSRRNATIWRIVIGVLVVVSIVVSVIVGLKSKEVEKDNK